MNVSLLLCFLYVFFLPSLVHAVVVVAHFASFLFSADHFVCGITIFITFSLSSTDIGNVFFFVFVFFLRVLLAFLILLYICVSAKSSVVCDCNWIARNASTQCVAFCILHIGVNCLWRCSPMPPQSRKICIKMHFRIFVRCSSKTQTANNKAKKKNSNNNNNNRQRRQIIKKKRKQK